MQQEIEELGRRIRIVMERVEEQRKGEKKTRKGWDEGEIKKKQVRKKLRECGDQCGRKKKEENEKWEREAENARTEKKL